MALDQRLSKSRLSRMSPFRSRTILAAQGRAEPGARVGPFLAGLVDRDAEDGGDLLVAQAGEMTQLDDAGRRRILGGEPAEGEQMVVGRGPGRSTRGTRCKPSPGLRRFRCRAFSTWMRRMDSAVAAKK